MIFNGDNEYNLVAKKRGGDPNSADYVAAVYYQVTNVIHDIVLIPTQTKGLEFDFDNGSVGNIYGIYGYGKYKIKLTSAFLDSIILDIDANATGDLLINFYNDSISYQFSEGNYPVISLSIANFTIQSWKKYGPTQNSQKNLGNFKYALGTIENPNNYNIIPLDCRKDCNVLTNVPDQNRDTNTLFDNRNGILSLNLTIEKDIFTRNTLIDTITSIIVKDKAALRIGTGKTFNMISPSFGYNNLIIEDSSALILYDSSKIIVHSPNRITLRQNSNLNHVRNSEIIIKNGAMFCNEGGRIAGSGKVVFDKGIFQLCSYSNDFVVEDSAKIILEDSAFVILPDNYTLRLRGNTTSLVMKPGSKMMFGENSGIVCDSGAKLIASDAAFTSVDSAKKWNGIFLKHRSLDTIKNCLISNANYGINIFGKNDDEGIGTPFSTEISGCSFVNKSGSELSLAVYAANSSNLLIMNNTVSSSNLIKGFAQGIYTEFCSGGNVNFIGNTINSTGNGMTLINSSPFVSQNIINGNQYSETGIFLDNSNGKFEYNVINDFYYSFYSMLSSPDLLKNIFDNSYAENIYLTYSSAPNLKPVSSGGNTYWLSGDNLIKGEPSNAGIYFEDESLPNMGFGYNRFILSNNDYYISGTVPGNFDSYFDIRENYWGTLSPDTGKFNVSNSIGILYDPFDDNSSESRSVNNYTLYDIGFGLKDTVFYLEGDNPGMAEELYLEAYQKESSGEYQEAIELYMELISDFKDSVYSVSSLSGLFNCHEKKNSTVTEFSALQNFYSDIFEDTTYSETQRNLSEDFMIKSKVRQNNIEGAVSDYNTIYMNNMNTAKGTHALINMEILSAGAGDNLSGGNEIENLVLKQNRINDIIRSVINKKSDNLSILKKQPDKFHLSQNFPNPFNPVTKIAYSIPVSGIVTIKIYDITGREMKTLVNEFRNAGSFEIEFDGGGLASGVYYYTLETNIFLETRKMILIK